MERQFDRYTVRGLRNLARERGLKRYSRLRRDELITLLINTGPSILDRNIETFYAPILQPTLAQPLPSTTSQSPTISINDLMKDLENVSVVQPSISPELNALKKKINDIFSKVKQINIKLSNSSLKNYAEEHEIEGIPVATPQEFLELTQPTIIKLLKNKRGVKVKMNLQCIMKRGEGKDEEKVKANFSSDENEINLRGTNVVKLYFDMIERILENYVSFLMKGSGWVFHSVVHLKVHTVIYETLKAGGWIPFPDWIANKKACINMKSENDECFTDCILRYLNPTNSHPERVDGNLKSKKNSLNMKGIKYPVSLLDIDKFERQNPKISVNVYEYKDKKKIRRIRAIKSLRENHINLLYIEDGEKSHYVLIKNFKALMSKQVSGNHNVEYCMLCNGYFGSKKRLEKHMKRCVDYDGVDLITPDPEKPEQVIKKFENYCRKIMVPFIVVVDFECLLEPIENISQEESNTIKTQKHIPVSYKYLICSFDRNVLKPVLRGYVGKDAEKKKKKKKKKYR